MAAQDRADYDEQVSWHLSFFKNHRLSQITIAEVDRYRAAKVKQGTLSATSIDDDRRLGKLLEVAVQRADRAQPCEGKAAATEGA